jgi:hypothetical protein
VQILQSHFSLTMSHYVSLAQWTAQLLPDTRDPGSEPQGGTYISIVCYIGDPDVIRSLASSPFRCFTRLCADNVLVSSFVTLQVLH